MNRFLIQVLKNVRMFENYSKRSHFCAKNLLNQIEMQFLTQKFWIFATKKRTLKVRLFLLFSNTVKLGGGRQIGMTPMGGVRARCISKMATSYHKSNTFGRYLGWGWIFVTIVNFLYFSRENGTSKFHETANSASSIPFCLYSENKKDFSNFLKLPQIFEFSHQKTQCLKIT